MTHYLRYQHKGSPIGTARSRGCLEETRKTNLPSPVDHHRHLDPSLGLCNTVLPLRKSWNFWTKATLSVDLWMLDIYPMCKERHVCVRVNWKKFFDRSFLCRVGCGWIGPRDVESLREPLYYTWENLPISGFPIHFVTLP